MGFGSDVFRQVLQLYLMRLPGALVISLQVTSGAAAIGMVLGLVLALGYLASTPLISPLARALVYFVRAIPVPPFLYLVYFGILALVFPIEPAYAGMIALGILLAPYMAELYRAGIQSVGAGLIEAGLSLGMSGALVQRRIVLPIALRVMLPAIGQLIVGTLINSSTVALLGGRDITGMSRNIIYAYWTTELYMVVAVTYFVICYPISRVLTWLERRMKVLT